MRRNVVFTVSLQWNLSIADIPWIAHKILVPNVKIIFKLPPNGGHLSITENFLRPVSIRYLEVLLHKGMKKPYLCTIIGSYGRDCVLIILFELYGSKTGFFEGNLFWVGHYDPLLTFILEEELIQYWHNLIQFLYNLSKVGLKTAYIII